MVKVHGGGDLAHMKRLVLIGDHDIALYGMRMLLRDQPDMEIAASCISLQEGLRAIAGIAPQLVFALLDTDAPLALESARAIIAAQLPRPTVIVALWDVLHHGEHVLGLGAAGFMTANEAVASLPTAARTVLEGGRWVSARLGVRMHHGIVTRPPGAPADDPAGLTPRERDIMGMLKLGYSTKQIASALKLGVRTVDFHRSNIKRKLGLKTGAAVIAYASKAS